MKDFQQLQNRAVQIANHFGITLEEAWQKLHGWIDRELGLSPATVQKVDGALVAVAHDVAVKVVEDVAQPVTAQTLAVAVNKAKELVRVINTVKSVTGH